MCMDAKLARCPLLMPSTRITTTGIRSDLHSRQLLCQLHALLRCKMKSGTSRMKQRHVQA